MATSVLVDDTDPAVVYSPGAWEAGPTSSFPPNSYYNNTFHHLGSGNQGGTVQYTFNGTSFLAGGAFVQKDNIAPFKYQCSVDGQMLLTAPNSNRVGILCQAPSLSDGLHVITIGVTKNSTSTSQLRIDYITYTPSSPPSIESDNLFIPASSSLINLEGHWENISSTSSNGLTGSSAKDATAMLSSNFSGRSVTWFNCPGNPGNVDETSSFTYRLDDWTSTSLVDSTPILFTATGSTAGNHQLQLTYNGGSLAMTICGLGVTQSAVNPYNPTQAYFMYATAVTSNSSENHPVPAPSSVTPASSSATKAYTVFIVGVVAGPIAILVLLALIASFLIKQHRQKRGVHPWKDTDGKE